MQFVTFVESFHRFLCARFLTKSFCGSPNNSNEHPECGVFKDGQIYGHQFCGWNRLTFLSPYIRMILQEQWDCSQAHVGDDKVRNKEWKTCDLTTRDFPARFVESRTSGRSPFLSTNAWSAESCHSLVAKFVDTDLCTSITWSNIWLPFIEWPPWTVPPCWSSNSVLT